MTLTLYCLTQERPQLGLMPETVAMYKTFTRSAMSDYYDDYY